MAEYHFETQMESKREWLASKGLLVDLSEEEIEQLVKKHVRDYRKKDKNNVEEQER